LERFMAAFEPCGFRWEAFCPAYGLAEATLIVSASLNVVTSSDHNGGGGVLVGCGRSLSDQQIVIADPDTLTQCSTGQIGEVWVAGSSVTQGYWEQRGETERCFQSHLADTGKGPFLRTGDLGFLDADGELFITGRLKDLIIIKGQNHYPQDVEQTVEQSHPALKRNSCAAFSIERDGEEQLVIVAEMKRHCRQETRRGQTEENFLDHEKVIMAIRREIAEHHGLCAYDVLLLRSWSIPRTSSGKIQRHACRSGYLAGTLDEWEGERA
jgi:acyl-CoA synthetase (AMP-forming)/AMP-acid ligase II